MKRLLQFQDELNRLYLLLDHRDVTKDVRKHFPTQEQRKFHRLRAKTLAAITELLAALGLSLDHRMRIDSRDPSQALPESVSITALMLASNSFSQQNWRKLLANLLDTALRYTAYRRSRQKLMQTLDALLLMPWDRMTLRDDPAQLIAHMSALSPARVIADVVPMLRPNTPADTIADILERIYHSGRLNGSADVHRAIINRHVLTGVPLPITYWRRVPGPGLAYLLEMASPDQLRELAPHLPLESSNVHRFLKPQRELLPLLAMSDSARLRKLWIDSRPHNLVQVLLVNRRRREFSPSHDERRLIEDYLRGIATSLHRLPGFESLEDDAEIPAWAEYRQAFERRNPESLLLVQGYISNRVIYLSFDGNALSQRPDRQCLAVLSLDADEKLRLKPVSPRNENTLTLVQLREQLS